jgi:uncharacterized protein (DUF2252 family)
MPAAADSPAASAARMLSQKLPASIAEDRWMAPRDRAAGGKLCRSQVPRSSHRTWEPGPGRPDPVALLEEQSADRLPELVPIRYERMSASPFAFYRGAACVMAADLAGTPQTGIRVQLCGDAHMANFGGFASPERQLIFDLNDFDETLPGPWEWDLKRLAASAAVAGRENDFKAKRRAAIVRDLVATYRHAMRDFARKSTLDVWYARLSVRDIREHLRADASRSEVKRFDKTVAKGERKDSTRAFAKLVVTEDGEPRIRSDPPLIVPIRDLTDGSGAGRVEHNVRRLLSSWSYRRSLSGDRRRVLERFRYADVARKVVGIGSVGTRCWVLLLLGRDSSDPLFLQAKEAPRSVLEPFAGRSEFSNQGHRVVEGQRLMQAASDTFLGWLHDPLDIDNPEPRDHYVRQLWDSKISPDIAAMKPSDMKLYARLCAWTLARAHARSGDAIAIAAYMGSSDAIDRAIAEFAEAYADQNERDHATLMDAIAAGRIRV